MEVPNMNMITPAMKRQLMAMSGITDMKEFDEIVSKLGRAHTGYLTRNNTITTSLQSMMSGKFSQQRFWPCHEMMLIKTIPAIPNNLYVSSKLASLYCGLG